MSTSTSKYASIVRTLFDLFIGFFLVVCFMCLMLLITSLIVVWMGRTTYGGTGGTGSTNERRTMEEWTHIRRDRRRDCKKQRGSDVNNYFNEDIAVIKLISFSILLFLTYSNNCFR